MLMQHPFHRLIHKGQVLRNGNPPSRQALLIAEMLEELKLGHPVTTVPIGWQAQFPLLSHF